MPANPQMRVVSGIQPTGGLHLGNLLGAILRWVRMQDEAECLFFLADLHALTIDVDPNELRSNIREMAAALIASGIDPAKSILFQQSAIPAHAELAWVLQCTARVGWVNRMTQFKEKTGKSREGASVGLYTYPVLQAADVLLYRATHVPVGEDQKQHLELARDIAIKFNTDYETELFVPPEPYIPTGAAARIMSLREGSVKMSKSDPSDMSRINLTDSDDQISQKIRKAKTDPAIRRFWKTGPRPRTSSAFTLQSLTRASNKCSHASQDRVSAPSSPRWPMHSLLCCTPCEPGSRSCATTLRNWTGCLRPGPREPRNSARRSSPKPTGRSVFRAEPRLPPPNPNPHHFLNSGHVSFWTPRFIRSVSLVISLARALGSRVPRSFKSISITKPGTARPFRPAFLLHRPGLLGHHLDRRSSEASA